MNSQKRIDCYKTLKNNINSLKRDDDLYRGVLKETFEFILDVFKYCNTSVQTHTPEDVAALLLKKSKRSQTLFNLTNLINTQDILVNRWNKYFPASVNFKFIILDQETQ